MEVKFKKLVKEAQTPRYSKPGDGALDLVCVTVDYQDKFIEYGTGIALEIPEGYVGLLFPRSSVSSLDIMLANAVGFIDHNYRGEIKLRYKKSYHHGTDEERLVECPHCAGEGLVLLEGASEEEICDTCGGAGDIIAYDAYEPGDRIAQLFIVERIFIEMKEVEDLSNTNRGDKGFGSSGK